MNFKIKLNCNEEVVSSVVVTVYDENGGLDFVTHFNPDETALELYKRVFLEAKDALKNSRISQVADQIYDNTVEDIVSCYPWKFCKAQLSLNRLTATPVFDEFKYAYQLPSDFVRAIRSEYQSDYKIHDKYVYSNKESLNFEYIIRPAEGDWPDYFARVVELRFAQLFSISIAEDAANAEVFEKLYEKALSKAKAIDSQDQPPSFAGYS